MKTWHLIIALIIIVLGLWYFYGVRAPSTDSQQNAPLTASNTTTDISSDLDQIPDDSASFDADAAASAENVEGF